MDISHIVPVYNKRDALGPTIASLMHQEGKLKRELILVDDHSPDDSVAVMEACTKIFPYVTIIRNSENRGPSVRLNQGAAIARGKYLHFLDHDDILPQNAACVMHTALEATGADFLYGTWKKIPKKAADLLDERVDENAPCTVSETPFDTVLHGRFKRMCVMVRKDAFDKAGGFDPRIFIQDESLPLRLARASSRMAVLDAAVNLVPIGNGNLSDHKSQLNHDRFLAYYYMVRESHGLDAALMRLLYQKAVSAVWKEVRARKRFPYFSKVLLRYLQTKLFKVQLDNALLDFYKAYMDKLPVLRSA
jgi:glycosyltransferase involved in cell wall biosynthesis